MRRQPAFAEALENELLFGERVRVFDEADGWAWLQLERDGYVGYVRADALRRELHADHASRQRAGHLRFSRSRYQVGAASATSA